MAEQLVPSSPEPVINIVLVGRTGNGKSATGNTLLGSNAFVSKKQALRVTMGCQMYRAAKQNGPIINVIDTPGLFDLGESADYISKEISYCLSLAGEGIHAVLFVLSALNRITPEEEATLNALQGIFESKILDYFIVLFTGGDVLECEGETLDEYLQTGCPPFLTNILRLCGGRKILFDNRTRDKDKKAEQLKQLYALIADVEQQTGGKPYTDNMHRTIKEENDKVRKQEMELESKNLAKAKLPAMKEKLRFEHEKSMQMMALAVENTLKQSAETHEKKIRKMIEELHKGQQHQQHQVENALKQRVETHEKEMRKMREELQRGQQHQVENALKQSAETHEKEMQKMREELQKGQQHQVENALKQGAETHEKEMRKMIEELHKGQQNQMENALKHNAETHKKEMRKMREELQKGHQHQVENALKQSAETHEKEMRKMIEELQKGQKHQVENALKQSAETHEKEMQKMIEELQKSQQHQEDNALKQRVETQESEIRRMREELQQRQLHRMENALKQNAEIHEGEMRIMREEIRQSRQHPLERGPPVPSKCECNIM